MRNDASSDSFQRALDEARRGRRSREDGDDAEAGAPHIRADLGLACAEASAGRALFDGAMAWATETASAPLALASPGAPALETGADIGDEFGLGADMTEPEMKRAWRAFVWRHHPDRQPPGARPRAGARVAAANALYDRARRDIARKV